MRLLFFILFLPNLVFSQIEVLSVAPQPNVFESCCGEVIVGSSWPRYVVDSWYGNPDVHGVNSGTVWFSTTVGPRTFYTNISENQRIFRGDTIQLAAGGGSTYEWSTGETTRIITVAPTETTTYSVTIEDDIEHSPDRTVTLYTTVHIEDKPNDLFTINVGTDYTICRGDEITLAPTYDSPTATYLWSTGATDREITITPTMPQTYSVEVTDYGITKIDNILIVIENCP